MAKHCDTLFEYNPITADFRKIRQAGRAMHVGFGVGAHGKLISLFIIYGRSGAGCSAKKAVATSAIIKACMQEALLYPEVPKFILGDFNGDWDAFPELDTLRDNMGWVDLNDVADQWGAKTASSNLQNCQLQ